MADIPLIRDEEHEDKMQRIIYASARGEDYSGGQGGGDDDGQQGGGEDDGRQGDEDDDFSSQFLNDCGEGLLFDDEAPLTTNSGEVYTYII